MKYTDALKIYNEGKSKWCFPRKGSIDHGKVIKIQGKPVVKVNNAVKKHSKRKMKLKRIPKRKMKLKKLKYLKVFLKNPKAYQRRFYK